MSTCIKCNSDKELKMLNFFTFHRSYDLVNDIELETHKEFTRREFLKDMDKHFDDFVMYFLCANCINNFEWDLGRVWEHYSEEGIKMAKNIKRNYDGV